MTHETSTPADLPPPQSTAGPSLSEQTTRLRKPGYRSPGQAAMFFRPVLSIEKWVTYALLRSGIDSRWVTFSWFVCGMTAYAVTAWGHPWSFAAGSLLVFLKMILDLSDGQIGRYRKRFLTESEDLASHMKGVYLDRVQHAIESPLWGLALGWGAYRLTENPWMVLCGASIAVLRTFVRFDHAVRARIREQFQDRVARLRKLPPADDPTLHRPQPALARRAAEKLLHWIANGKRFNTLILLCGVADGLLWQAGGSARAVPALLVVSGVLSPCVLALRIASVQFGDSLFDDFEAGPHARNSGPDDDGPEPGDRIPA